MSYAYLFSSKNSLTDFFEALRQLDEHIISFQFFDCLLDGFRKDQFGITSLKIQGHHKGSNIYYKLL